MRRVNESVRQVLAESVPELKDPRIGLVTVTGVETSPDLRQAYESDPVVREVIDIARTLEGTNRNSGTHAAGVVIGNGPLMDYVPLQRVMRKGEDGARKSEAVMTCTVSS